MLYRRTCIFEEKRTEEHGFWGKTEEYKNMFLLRQEDKKHVLKINMNSYFTFIIQENVKK